MAWQDTSQDLSKDRSKQLYNLGLSTYFKNYGIDYKAPVEAHTVDRSLMDSGSKQFTNERYVPRGIGQTYPDENKTFGSQPFQGYSDRKSQDLYSQYSNAGSGDINRVQRKPEVSDSERYYASQRGLKDKTIEHPQMTDQMTVLTEMFKAYTDKKKESETLKAQKGSKSLSDRWAEMDKPAETGGVRQFGNTGYRREDFGWTSQMESQESRRESEDSWPSKNSNRFLDEMERRKDNSWSAPRSDDPKRPEFSQPKLVDLDKKSVTSRMRDLYGDWNSKEEQKPVDLFSNYRAGNTNSKPLGGNYERSSSSISLGFVPFSSSSRSSSGFNPSGKQESRFKVPELPPRTLASQRDGRDLYDRSRDSQRSRSDERDFRDRRDDRGRHDERDLSRGRLDERDQSRGRLDERDQSRGRLDDRNRGRLDDRDRDRGDRQLDRGRVSSFERDQDRFRNEPDWARETSRNRGKNEWDRVDLFEKPRGQTRDEKKPGLLSLNNVDEKRRQIEEMEKKQMSKADEDDWSRMRKEMGNEKRQENDSRSMRQQYQHNEWGSKKDEPRQHPFSVSGLKETQRPIKVEQDQSRKRPWEKSNQDPSMQKLQQYAQQYAQGMDDMPQASFSDEEDEKPKQEQNSWKRCSSCEIQFPTYKAFKDHSNSKEHIERAKQAKKNAQEVTEPPVVVMKSQIKTREEFNHKYQMKFSCEACSMTCVGLKGYIVHLVGKRHTSTIQVDDKKSFNTYLDPTLHEVLNQVKRSEAEAYIKGTVPEKAWDWFIGHLDNVHSGQVSYGPPPKKAKTVQDGNGQDAGATSSLFPDAALPESLKAEDKKVLEAMIQQVVSQFVKHTEGKKEAAEANDFSQKKEERERAKTRWSNDEPTSTPKQDDMLSAQLAAIAKMKNEQVGRPISDFNMALKEGSRLTMGQGIGGASWTQQQRSQIITSVAGLMANQTRGLLAPPLVAQPQPLVRSLLPQPVMLPVQTPRGILGMPVIQRPALIQASQPQIQPLMQMTMPQQQVAPLLGNKPEIMTSSNQQNVDDMRKDWLHRARSDFDGQDDNRRTLLGDAPQRALLQEPERRPLIGNRPEEKRTLLQAPPLLGSGPNQNARNGQSLLGATPVESMQNPAPLLGDRPPLNEKPSLLGPKPEGPTWFEDEHQDSLLGKPGQDSLLGRPGSREDSLVGRPSRDGSLLGRPSRDDSLLGRRPGDDSTFVKPDSRETDNDRDRRGEDRDRRSDDRRNNDRDRSSSDSRSRRSRDRDRSPKSKDRDRSTRSRDRERNRDRSPRRSRDDDGDKKGKAAASWSKILTTKQEDLPYHKKDSKPDPRANDKSKPLLDKPGRALLDTPQPKTEIKPLLEIPIVNPSHMDKQKTTSLTPEKISAVYGAIMNLLAPGVLQTQEDFQLATKMIAELTKATVLVLQDAFTPWHRDELRKMAVYMKSNYPDHPLLPAFQKAGIVSIDIVKLLASLDPPTLKLAMAYLQDREYLQSHVLGNNEEMKRYLEREMFLKGK